MASDSILIKKNTRPAKNTNFPAWEYALLQKRGWPATTANLIGLNLWAKSEGMPATENNPLAITNPNQEFGPDSGTVNSNGVVRFDSLQGGVDATSAFLDAPSYAGIDAAFKQGGSLTAIYTAINASPWCRGCTGGRYPAALAQYAGGGSVALGSIPIFHGGSASGANAAQGGQAESASGFYQCNPNSVIVGGLGFNVLNACEAKALVGGLLIASGVLVMTMGGIILMRNQVGAVAGLAGQSVGFWQNLGGRSSTPSAAPPVDSEPSSERVTQYEGQPHMRTYTDAQGRSRSEAIF